MYSKRQHTKEDIQVANKHINMYSMLLNRKYKLKTDFDTTVYDKNQYHQNKNKFS